MFDFFASKPPPAQWQVRGLIKTSSGQVPVSIGGYLQVYTFGVRDRKRHVLNQHITVPIVYSNSS